MPPELNDAKDRASIESGIDQNRDIVDVFMVLGFFGLSFLLGTIGWGIANPNAVETAYNTAKLAIIGH